MAATPAYGVRVMIRHEHRRETTTVSDRELGIAALLLLLAMVVTVAFLPSLI